MLSSTSEHAFVPSAEGTMERSLEIFGVAFELEGLRPRVDLVRGDRDERRELWLSSLFLSTLLAFSAH